MRDLQFKIDGPIAKGGIPLPLALSALSNFQSIVDKSYLVISDKNRMTPSERERFYIRATEFRSGSLLTYFDIILHGVQLGLPLVSSLGPQNIWDLTRDSFNMLKLVCEGVRGGEVPKYQFNNGGNVNVSIGGNHFHFHPHVYQAAKSSLSNYQNLTHLLDKEKLSEISAGSRSGALNDIHLTESDRNIFDVPTKMQKETIELDCEIFNFDKYKNTGRLSVSMEGQAIPNGNYNFAIIGGQDSISYIYALLRTQIRLNCLVEDFVSPFGEVSIHKLHIVDVVQ